MKLAVVASIATCSLTKPTVGNLNYQKKGLVASDTTQLPLGGIVLPPRPEAVELFGNGLGLGVSSGLTSNLLTAIKKTYVRKENIKNQTLGD